MAYGLPLGPPCEITRGQERGRHGGGGGGCEVAGVDVGAGVTGDAGDRGRQVRHPPRRFLPPLEAAVTQGCGRGERAQGRDLRAAICGEARAVSPPAPFQGDTVSRLAEGRAAVSDRLALRGQPVVCTAGRCEGQLELGTAQGRLGGAARCALFGLRPGALQTCLGLSKSRPGLGAGLGGRARLGGEWGTHGGAACRLARVQRWGVRGAKRRGARRPQTGGLLTGGWPPRTGPRCHGGGQARLPAVWLAGWREWFPHNAVAHRRGGHSAPSARAGVVLGHGDGGAGQVLGQAGGGGGAEVHAGGCPRAGDLGLRPRGGRDKSITPCQGKQETEQTPAARADLDPDQGEGEHAPLEAGQARATVQAPRPFGTDSAGGMPEVPRVQGGAGPLKRLDGLTLGNAGGWQVERGLAQVGPRTPIPAWMTGDMAVDRVARWQMDSREHGDRSPQPLSDEQS
jgi:hypothetical protein